MIQLRSSFTLGLVLSLGAFAQFPPPPPPPAPPGFEGIVNFQGGDFVFVRAEFGLEGKLVKNSPYSAQAVTEFTQTLADGNRIHRMTSASVARDSEGRTRREQAITAIGPLAASGDMAKSVFIHDPVAGVSYTLEPNNRIARTMHDPRRFYLEGSSAQAADMQKMKARARTKPSETDLKTDDLGSQVMEGVSVQGKRVTRTIPAGQIGNELPLQIVTETWFSEDLQAVVMSRTSDPRGGETVYKLTNVSRAEPDPSLFQVPGDFTVTEGRPMGARGMRMAPKRD